MVVDLGQRGDSVVLISPQLPLLMPELNEADCILLGANLKLGWNGRHGKKLGSVSEGTDFGQKKKLKPRVYWFMV